jgi:hypothetical protein
MKLLIVQFSPVSCHFISPRTKYSPQHIYTEICCDNSKNNVNELRVLKIENLILNLKILV